MPDAAEIAESLDKHEFVLRESAITIWADRMVMMISEVFNWIWIALLVVIIGNVILRYVFSQGMIEFEELQWHLYAIGWLVGLSSTFVVDGHVRVDVLHDRLTYRKKLWLEVSGLLFLFLPFVIFIIIYSIPLVELSWTTNERSTSANGLPARWVVKGFLLFSFVLLLIAGLSRLMRVALSIVHGSPNDDAPQPQTSDQRV